MTDKSQGELEQWEAPELSPVTTGLNHAVPHGHDPAALIALAVEKDLDVDKLGQLLELQERWQATQARRAFHVALGEFQRICPTIVKQNDVRDRNGKLMYHFADLDAIKRAIAPALEQAQLTYRWRFEADGSGGVTAVCVITHAEGHSEETPSYRPATKGQNTNASQDAAIAEKYAMRGSLIGALGLTTADTDTDGIVAADEAQPATAPKLITQEQAVSVLTRASALGALDALLAFVGVNRVADIPASRLEEIENNLSKKEARANQS